MLSAGYWMNARNGKLVSVSEHGGEVLANPAMFGMSDQDIEAATGGGTYNPYDTSKGSARGRLIVAAAKKGWVRVRSNRDGDWSLQLFGTAGSAAKNFLAKLGRELGPYSRVQVSDFATGQQEMLPFNEFRKAVKAGHFTDAGAAGPAVGRDAAAETGDKQDAARADAIPNALSDEAKRRVMRGRIGQKAGIPMPDVEEGKKTKAKIVKESFVSAWTKAIRDVKLR